MPRIRDGERSLLRRDTGASDRHVQLSGCTRFWWNRPRHRPVRPGGSLVRTVDLQFSPGGGSRILRCLSRPEAAVADDRIPGPNATGRVSLSPANRSDGMASDLPTRDDVQPGMTVRSYGPSTIRWVARSRSSERRRVSLSERRANSSVWKRHSASVAVSNSPTASVAIRSVNERRSPVSAPRSGR